MNAQILNVINNGIASQQFSLIGSSIPRDQYKAVVDLAKLSLPTNIQKSKTSDFKYFKLPLILTNKRNEPFHTSVSLTSAIFETMKEINDEFTLIVGQDPKNEAWNTYKFSALVDFPVTP